MRTRKQMIAIIMALKKKGLLERLRMVGASAQSPQKAAGVVKISSLSSFVSAGQKKIPYHASPGARRSKVFADSYSPSAIQEHLSALPDRDLSRLKIKGIYALTGHEFYRVIGGAARRSSPATSIQEGVQALKAARQQARSAAAEAGLSPAVGRVFVLGLHQNGRVFVNVSSLQKLAESIGLAGADLGQVARAHGKSLFLHELGHNIDSPSGRFGIGAQTLARELPGYKRSQSREFFRALGLSFKKASVMERGQAAEAFAGLYAAYRTDKKTLRFAMTKRKFELLERIFDNL